MAELAEFWQNFTHWTFKKPHSGGNVPTCNEKQTHFWVVFYFSFTKKKPAPPLLADVTQTRQFALPIHPAWPACPVWLRSTVGNSALLPVRLTVAQFSGPEITKPLSGFEPLWPAEPNNEWITAEWAQREPSIGGRREEGQNKAMEKDSHRVLCGETSRMHTVCVFKYRLTDTASFSLLLHII